MSLSDCWGQGIVADEESSCEAEAAGAAGAAAALAEAS